MKMNKFFGRRVFKTGIAVFVTASLCIQLDLPVVFAVITAIVTTEPTARDSLKKGLIRLPAAAIGAGFALLFELFLGQSALTFAFVAMLTILVCHHMKLDHGTLVATLTAVAMIPGSTEGFITEFIFRLSGTSIGIIISTLVNFAILPPKFTPLLVDKVNHLYESAAKDLTAIIHTLFEDEHSQKRGDQLRKLNQKLEKAFQLSEFQQAEWHYRKSNDIEERSFYFLQTKLMHLQQLISHISNISFVKLEQGEFLHNEKEIIFESCDSISAICTTALHDSENDTKWLQHKLYRLLKEEVQLHHKFQQKKALYFELLAILNCLASLQKLTKEEHNFSIKNKDYPTYIFPKQVQYD